MAKKKQAAKQKQGTGQKQIQPGQKQENKQGQKYSQMNSRPVASQTQRTKALMEVTPEKDWFEYKADRLEQFANYLAKVGQPEIAEETRFIATAVRAAETKAPGAQLPEVNEDLSGLWTMLDMHANKSVSPSDQIALSSAIEIYKDSHYGCIA
ncbi:MAG: hypothetical protein K2X81_06315 [Candidatus Obscuribacterales bacterium]|nr:hypothetical protein [Candidatus Obscuribacterales bacterium]